MLWLRILNTYRGERRGGDYRFLTVISKEGARSPELPLEVGVGARDKQVCNSATNLIPYNKRLPGDSRLIDSMVFAHFFHILTRFYISQLK